MLTTRLRFLAAVVPAGRWATPRAAVLPRVAALHATRMQLSDDFGLGSSTRPPSEKQVRSLMRICSLNAYTAPQATPARRSP